MKPYAQSIGSAIMMLFCLYFFIGNGNLWWLLNTHVYGCISVVTFIFTRRKAAAMEAQSAAVQAHPTMLPTPPPPTVRLTTPLTTSQLGLTGQYFVPKYAPPVDRIEQTEPIRGWRIYGLVFDQDTPTLCGARMHWDSKYMQAECLTYEDEVARHFVPKYAPPEVQKKWIDLFTAKGPDAANEWLKNLPPDTLIHYRNKPTVTDKFAVCKEHLEYNSCPDSMGCGVWFRGTIPDEELNALNPQTVHHPCHLAARVIAWGVVLTDDQGNGRATDVEIESLYLTQSVRESYPLDKYVDFNRLARDISEAYDVPVTLVRNAKDINDEAQSSTD